MPRGRRNEDLAMLKMALVGYEHEKQRIDEKIREIEARLSGTSAAGPAMAATSKAKNGRVKRVLSPAARKRIAAAQKKRWAEHRKQLGGSSATAAAKPAGVKRVLSPAARKRIAAAQKKRWAEHRKRIAGEQT